VASLVALGAALLLIAYGRTTVEAPPLRLATTTSTYDSGLLGVLLPAFERDTGLAVDVIAVGTGQALALGERGDADVLLVHAPALEMAFVASGHGLDRAPVMYNDFVLVGPDGDPAGIARSESAAAALARIAESRAPFASRGDRSGTHQKELSLWEAAGSAPDASLDWYLPIGQGMGATLTFANERGAYALTDRATFLAQEGRLPDLVILVGGASIAQNPDPALRNPYSVLRVSDVRHPAVASEAGRRFADWITAAGAQRRIAEFGRKRFGRPLFQPDSEAWRRLRAEPGER